MRKEKKERVWPWVLLVIALELAAVIFMARGVAGYWFWK